MKWVGYTYFVDSGAVAYYNAYFGSGSGPYQLDNVYCSGTESSLLSCNRRYSIGVHDCRPGNEAGVKCFTGEFAVPLCAEYFVLLIEGYCEHFGSW